MEHDDTEEGEDAAVSDRATTIELMFAGLQAVHNGTVTMAYGWNDTSQVHGYYLQDGVVDGKYRLRYEYLHESREIAWRMIGERIRDARNPVLVHFVKLATPDHVKYELAHVLKTYGMQRVLHTLRTIAEDQIMSTDEEFDDMRQLAQNLSFAHDRYVDRHLKDEDDDE